MGFAEAQKAIAELIDGRVLVGHGLTHDFEVMMLSHPRKLTRDTAHYKPLCPYRPRALRDLASEQLGVTNLHAGAHDSVQDARCALAIYHKHKVEWEQSLKGVGRAPTAAVPTKADRAQAKKQAKVDARAAAQAALSAENEFDKLLKHI
jgi:RNA exonuclease 4